MRARRPTLLVAVGAVTVLVTAGCSQPGNEVDISVEEAPSSSSTSAAPSGSPSSPVAEPGAGEPRVTETIATGLEAPWGLDFLPDGDAIVTERDTRRVLRISGPDHDVEEIGVLDEAAPEGEGGVLGVAVSPTFERDRLLYFYLTTADDNRVVRARLRGGGLGPTEVVLDGIANGFIHDGGRLLFGPDGNLFVSTGETGEPPLAQDTDSLNGKILRITPDGDPVRGNPFDNEVLSYGHRNVQGLAFDANGRLWASEFGADAFDELNQITPGGNFGWPEVEGTGGEPDFVDPQQVWDTDDASPSGLAYDDGYLWMASLQGERLWRVQVRKGRAVDPTPFFVGEYGRMRTVAVAPDGTLWLMTSNRDTRGEPGPDDDQILQITP